jgi:hypothetical protein
MSGNQRNTLLALAAVVLVVGFFVARQASDDDDGGSTTTATAAQTGTSTTSRTVAAEPTKPQPPLVEIRDGAPVGGARELTFQKGGTVDFRVRSDAPGEVHVHGYDVEKELPAGKPVRFRFPADIDGRFEVELHGADVQIARIEVSP